MKITIIGATGRAGNLLVKEAVSRGHEVTAIVRNALKFTIPNVKIIEKNLFDLSWNDLKNNDVIIDAFATWTPDTIEQHKTSLKYICDLISGHPTRLLVVGGAGSLYTDATHTMLEMDSPSFHDDWKPVARKMKEAFDALKLRDDINWTYMSPSENFVFEGARSGKYKIGKDELLFNAIGKSEICYADYAVAMIDEAENAKYVKERITVVGQ